MAAPFKRFRQLAFPREKGGWSMVAEPLVLALLLHPRPDTLLLVLAAACLFFFRRPSVALSRVPPGPDAGAHLIISFLLASLFVATTVPLLLKHGGKFTLFFFLSLPFSVVFLAYDRLKRARDPVAEYCGAVGFTFVPSTAAWFGGLPVPECLALMILLALRSLSAVADVRFKLRQVRQLDPKRGPMLLLHFASLAIATALAVTAMVPPAMTAVFILISLRSWWLIRSPAMRSPRDVGFAYMRTGIAFIALTALIYHLDPPSSGKPDSAATFSRCSGPGVPEISTS